MHNLKKGYVQKVGMQNVSSAHSESIVNDGTKMAESCPNEHERNLNVKQDDRSCQ